MERLCLDCRAALKGRADKKFCDDQCRSNYNNHIRSDDHIFMKQVNQVLKKNREILKSKNPEGKSKVKKDFLIRKGFNFNYHTHTYTTLKGNTYFFCYEFGYLGITEDEFLLVQRIEKKAEN